MLKSQTDVILQKCRSKSILFSYAEKQQQKQLALIQLTTFVWDRCVKYVFRKYFSTKHSEFLFPEAEAIKPLSSLAPLIKTLNSSPFLYFLFMRLGLSQTGRVLSIVFIWSECHLPIITLSHWIKMDNVPLKMITSYLEAKG